MELYIFRHGEKELDGCFVGQTDVGLTRKGEKQNAGIEKKLLEFKAEKVFTSDLKRTFVGNGIKQEALREINFGSWERLGWDEIEKRYPLQAARYLDHPLRFRFPGGENYQEFKERVINWMTDLTHIHVGRIGIVTHQGVIRTLLCHYNKENFWEIRIKSGEGIKLKLNQ